MFLHRKGSVKRKDMWEYLPIGSESLKLSDRTKGENSFFLGSCHLPSVSRYCQLLTLQTDQSLTFPFLFGKFDCFGVVSVLVCCSSFFYLFSKRTVCRSVGS